MIEKESENSLVTVIVPVHNTGMFLRQCLDSILQQTFSDFRIICVDSSDDDTSQILNEYQTENNNIEVIYNENSSYGFKINLGIREAKSKWIGIVDSDDWIEKDFLDHLVNIATVNDIDFCKTDYSNFINNGNSNEIVEYCNIATSQDYYDRVISFSQYPELLSETSTAIWTGLYNVEFLKKNGIILNESPGASYQDTGFFLQTCIKAKKIYYSHNSFYRYRIDNINSSVKDNKKYSLISSEFRWFEDNILKGIVLNEKQYGYYLSKKMKAYFWNVERLEAHYRKLFLEDIKKEIVDMIERKEYQNIPINYLYFLIEIFKYFLKD